MMGPVGPAFAAGFGALAALLLIGGAVLLRWQRTRLQFSLMQTALEKGTTPLLGNVPLWLLSLRQGAMIFVLGAGLIVVGGGLHGIADKVAEPTAAEFAQARLQQPGPPDGNEGQRPPMERGGEMRRPGPPEGRLGPPPRDEPPAIQQWHRAQDQKAVGTLAIASGFILVLLGFVRVIFAFAERKYSTTNSI
ncbi:MAG TPA: hypothetical protein VH255_07105 [Verrucomicrobiae bacterium]|nr:hypothetical protein [Verrucomicrobiae bacterium]